MLFILVVVVALVSWALHLMQQAIDKREFSLMLAGLLVSSAAAALVGVYMLMSSCVATMTQMSQDSRYYSEYSYSEYSYVDPVYEEQVYQPSNLVSSGSSTGSSLRFSYGQRLDESAYTTWPL